jgi:hypothetical protein
MYSLYNESTYAYYICKNTGAYTILDTVSSCNNIITMMILVMISLKEVMLLFLLGAQMLLLQFLA